MAWYDNGTVSVTNGSTTVTGSGTNFIAGAQIGEAFYGPDGRLYEIQAIVSATSLTLGSPYLGANQTGQDYYIIPTQSLVADLASQVSTLISDFQSVKDEAGEGKFDDGTAALPGITFNLDQDTGLSRPAANQIGFSTAGVQRALLSSTALTLNVPLVATGDVTIPDRIIHAGDTNTQIRFPANDVVSIETNGAERIRVTSAGNVGIGTSSPATALDVNGSIITTSGTTNQRGVFIGHQNNINSSFVARSENGAVDTGNRVKFNYADNSLSLDVNSGERLRITSAGNVGIGTSSPDFALTLATNKQLKIFGNNIGTKTDIILTDSAAIGANISMHYLAGSDHIFRSSVTDHTAGLSTGSESMRITSTGNVGINESAPDYRLDVNGSFGFTPGSSVTPADNGDVVFELTNNTTLTIKAKGSDGVVRSGTVTLA